MINKFLYKSYRFLFRYERWRRRRFTGPGLVLSFLVLVVGILGLDTHISLVHQVAAWLLSALLLSFILSRFFFGMSIRVDRQLPKYATAGEPFVYHVTFENRSIRKQTGLQFYENLGDPRPTLEELLSVKEPDEDKRNLWDRKILYYRWLWLISKKRIVDDQPHTIPHLTVGGTARIAVRAVPRNRGQLSFSGVEIARPDPLGFLKSLHSVTAPQTMVVLPRRYRLPPVELPGGRRLHPRGVHLASSIGNQDEFVSLRDYRPGDPLRRIHWKSTARKNEPIIKEYQDEFFVRHALILDTFTDAAYSECFEEAVRIAASFVCSMQTQESLLDLIFVGDQPYRFSSGRGTASYDKLLEILAVVQTCRHKPFETIASSVLEHADRFSGCICVLLAWEQERMALVRRLIRRGIPLTVIVVSEEHMVKAIDPGPMADEPERLRVVTVGHIEKGLAGA